MGNRAVITFVDGPQVNVENAPSIYLHWNGGISSVKGFLAAAKALGIRGNDSVYCCARTAQAIGNFFGGTLSLGVGRAGSLDCDNFDNGQYIVSNFEIVERRFKPDYAELEDVEYVEKICAAVLEINQPIFNREG